MDDERELRHPSAARLSCAGSSSERFRPTLLRVVPASMRGRQRRPPLRPHAARGHGILGEMLTISTNEPRTEVPEPPPDLPPLEPEGPPEEEPEPDEAPEPPREPEEEPVPV
jgi:hypothetical protein